MGLITKLQKTSLHSLLHSSSSSSSLSSSLPPAPPPPTPTAPTSRNLSIFEKICLSTEILLGISELHSVGLIHGDIKPANILLSKDGGPEGWGAKLADFGISRIRRPAVAGKGFTTAITRTKELKGTPSYLAPEFFSSESPDQYLSSSRASDAYAISVLLWEIFAEKVPYANMNLMDLMSALKHGQRPSLGDLPSDTPPSVVSLIQSCWSPNIAERKSSLDCFVSLSQCKDRLSRSFYNIFMSYTWADQEFVKVIYRFLVRQGYRIWLDLDDMGHELNPSMQMGIANSQVCLIWMCFLMLLLLLLLIMI